MKQKRDFGTWTKVAKISLIVFFLAVVIIVLVRFDLSEIRGFINQHRNLTFIISLSAIIITGVTFIPTIPVTLFFSVLIGPIPATIITTLGETFTALVHYHVGKQIGDVVNFEAKKARLPFNLGKLPVTSPLFLLIGRAIPGGPKGLSFICGAYSVPLFLYLWTTFITNLFGAAFVAFSGNGLIKF